jgi:DNA repair exonuclease SbcCD ATPase subunit
MKIILDNFMAHEHTEIDIVGDTVAVVGKNGSGKSSLLEAIPYCYFGISRFAKEDLSRNFGDGSHYVEIIDKGYRVKRGRKVNGKGFCEVRDMKGELISKGSDAAGWSSSHMGMDSVTFMQTAYFGMSDEQSDKLFKVTPAIRLETLQKLADVGKYKMLHDKAKKMRDNLKKDYESKSSTMEGISSSLLEEGSLEKDRDTLKEDIEKYALNISKKETKLSKLRLKEESYRAFSVEKATLDSEIQVLSSSVHSKEESLIDNQYTVTSSMEKIINLKNSLVDYKTELKTYSDISALDKKLSELSVSLTEKRTLKSLKSTGVESSSKGLSECPLCDSELSDTKISEWKDSISVIEANIDAIVADLESTNKLKNKVTTLNDNIISAEEDIEKLQEQVKESEGDIKILTVELKTKRSELNAKQLRLNTVTEKLGSEYDELLTNIDTVVSELNDLKENKATKEGEIKRIKESIKKDSENRNRIKELKIEVKDLHKQVLSYEALMSAWNRYGIPLTLMERLRKRIEERSTEVYQSFDNGNIELRRVEDRGHPGVKFYLVDKKGPREYVQLSKGEKAMVFVAVRVAISQIVSHDSNVKVDYLVLDEIMDGLDSERRDDLVKLINKTLRKIFPRVIMVSHIEMRDIFSSTIFVKAVNGIPEVTVS